MKDFNLQLEAIINKHKLIEKKLSNQDTFKTNEIIDLNKEYSEITPIVELINSNFLVEKYEVFKKYPSSIEIKIEKTNFLASTNINGKNYIVGSNGKFINTKEKSCNMRRIIKFF